MSFKDIVAVLLIAASIVIFVVGCELSVANSCLKDGHSWVYCQRQR